MRRAVEHWKAAGLDLSPVLHRPELPEGASLTQVVPQDHGLAKALDNELIEQAEKALLDGTPVQISVPIRNVNRTVGTLLGSHVTRRYGGAGLPDGTIDITLTGSAGQSLGAFLPRGIVLRLVGDANDYVGKGLSGGRVVVRPSEAAPFAAEDNVIAGNTLLYGATGGSLFVRGPGRRALLRAQQRGDRGRRGRRRPRLRVHDRRPGGDPRADRAQRGRRHERRRGVPARPGREQGQPRDGRARAARRG
jgi:hypothetical protein